MKNIFKSIPNLEKLEQTNKWNYIIDLLNANWQKNKNNEDNFIRFLSENWYMLSNWDICEFNKYGCDYNTIKQNLITCFEYARHNFQNNDLINVILGYMLSLFPNFFYNEEENNVYSQYEKIGNELIRIAYFSNRNNDFYHVLYCNNINKNSEAYCKSCENLFKNIDNILPGCSVIELYFKDVIINSYRSL